MASINNKRDSKEKSIEEYSFIYGDEVVAYEVIHKTFAEGKKRRSRFEFILIAVLP